MARELQNTDLAASAVQEESPDDDYVFISPFTVHGDPLPAPSNWPKWSPLAHRVGRWQNIYNTSSCWKPIPPEQIPRAWSNDWHYHQASWRWHVYYGGMRWWFNEVLHIPGEPILLLFSQDNGRKTGGDRELIQVDEHFFLYTYGNHFMDRMTVMIEGNPTLETVLSGLRGEVPLLYSEEWAIDELAFANYEVWKHRAPKARRKTFKDILSY
ncbi:hypothetical protein FRB95_007816 [Tulasnella sp. JGI-2019a]|nr:hypothetical protein FRB95_007816 [Tulasnella sp. JGI-2019a]